LGTLLVFTENYWPGVAGASYLVDLTNGAAECFENVVVASNPEALNETDLRRMSRPVFTEHVRVLTNTRIWSLLHKRSYTLSVLLGRAAQLLDPLVVEYNAMLCRRLIRRVRPSAVLSFNGGYPAARSVLAMTLAAHRKGVWVAMSVVSMPVPRRRRLAWYENWLDGRIGAAADVIIVNAPQIAVALTALRGLPSEKMRVVHNALPDSPERVRHSTAGRVRIGCVSRMDSMKGIPHLIEAFARLAHSHPEVDLILVGSGPELPNLRELACSLNVEDRIEFTGYFDGDVASIVSTFDIYAYPSLWEGLPYAILEAMRAGCAVIATNVGGVAEAIIDEDTGLLIAPGSTDELAEALLDLIDDASKRQRIAAAGRERFERTFSLNAMHLRAAVVFGEANLAAQPSPSR